MKIDWADENDPHATRFRLLAAVLMSRFTALHFLAVLEALQAYMRDVGLRGDDPHSKAAREAWCMLSDIYKEATR